ncbi:YhcH/YjgK/YiaL family protein [Aliivibrio sp. S4TY2]|uniref:YhcH/YjgK/YiaL family protein n=1 Tax=unclassified Aliivibrio TaxID=2645654 RepID=UPI002378ABD9|nr:MULTISPECIES: YhcH/YjgK/YiaL family protein [unclassified Aliivibrio]MDD9156204.1 YhcH/YjgK/YiaL family protein [Aliivibrio sp. S4TY2]MDD9160551.1 YhcH/YjgK/YiaL family protein [Aliivibrio sp. S4TY1]MDD9163912.1 YhcH/YjgK/YiaL family protein [Aliivibrio sp. S4MY2]MDD9168113.1 YhcH/YjgK/YiaL family protein [Aliivibrio sp. S4MY4]MDD9185108.1 YhcH/YjgK/YiaL family protein [Aliivibrio sp. S4MY3]
MFKGKWSDDIQGAALHPVIIEIIQKVKEQTIENTEVGNYPLPDESVYFIVNDKTELKENRRSEIHHKYLDVQLILEGTETFGYSEYPLLSIEDDYLEEKDIAFSNDVQDEQFVTLEAGEFIIFNPKQPHRPLVAVDEQPAAVKKLIIKVNSALLV